MARGGREALFLRRALDSIEFTDALDDVMGEARRLGALRDLEVTASGMGHTPDFDDAAIDKIAIVPTVGVGLQIAMPAVEEGGRMFARAIGGELIDQQRFVLVDHAAPHPQPRGGGLAGASVLPRQRRVVAGQDVGRLEPLPHALDQRRHRLANHEHPIGERAARQFDALAAEDLLLPRQGQMVAELLHRHVGE